MNNNVLTNPPKYFRSPISRGGLNRVEREGGYRGAGLIRGVSVITGGIEAAGHGVWIDDVTLEQTADAINSMRNGIKSRFSHPSASGDSLGKHIGRVMDAEVEGEQVLSDLHFLQSSHQTPTGDLATYTMTLADEDPQSFGISIAFQHDQEAMDHFVAEHSFDGEFKSPDPRNVNNYPHVRIQKSGLHAADVVDNPAANDGLFHREDDVAKQFDELAAYAFGLTNERPASSPLNLDPSRMRGFATRFLDNHKIVFRSNEMAENATEMQPADVPAKQATEAPSDVTVETPAAEAPLTNGREEAAEFAAKFGDKGAVWFAEGLTFEQCRERQLEELRKENEQLKQKLAARPTDGEQTPVSFDEGETKRSGYKSLNHYAKHNN